jgi:catalase (peroxidase I)
MANEIQEQNLSTESTRPAPGRRQMGPTNRDWWPNKLDLRALRQNSPLSDLWARSSIMPRASVSRATHQRA